MKNYYEILQVFPNTSAQEIKDAFRFLLFRYHPDHNRGREDWAVERTMELVEAYHVLSDPPRRAHHDLLRTVKIREAPPKKKFALFNKPSDRTKAAEPIFADGVAKFRGDEYEASLLAFRKAAELDPQYPNVKFNLAAAFLAIERYSDAVVAIQEHVARNKEDVDAKSLQSKISTLAAKLKQRA